MSKANTSAELGQGEPNGLLREVINLLPDCIFIKDTRSRMCFSNQAHARLLGVADPRAVVGKTDHEIFPAEQADGYLAAEQHVISTGERFHEDEAVLDPRTGETVWMQTTKVPLRDAEGRIVGVAGINRDITDRKHAELRAEVLHRDLLQATRYAGMAEVATGVLHNVSNVLNSVNVSASVIAEKLRDSKIAGVAKLARLLREQGEEVGRFLTEDERGQQVPVYLEQLAKHLEQERAEFRRELEGLCQNIEHIKEIVTTQQNYSRVYGAVEKLVLPDLVDDALRIHGGAYLRHGVSVVREFEPLPEISADKHKILQILVNLLHNAKYACDASKRSDKQVTVRLKSAGADRVRIEVADNGIGIAPDNVAKLFSQGFTTRKGGHGFGLHSGALAARELGGTLTAHSVGLGQGATFILELPTVPPPKEGGEPS